MAYVAPHVPLYSLAFPFPPVFLRNVAPKLNTSRIGSFRSLFKWVSGCTCGHGSPHPLCTVQGWDSVPSGHEGGKVCQAQDPCGDPGAYVRIYHSTLEHGPMWPYGRGARDHETQPLHCRPIICLPQLPRIHPCVSAAEPIAAGEAITISYVPCYLSTAQRNAALEKYFFQYALRFMYAVPLVTRGVCLWLHSLLWAVCVYACLVVCMPVWCVCQRSCYQKAMARMSHPSEKVDRWALNLTLSKVNHSALQSCQVEHHVYCADHFLQRDAPHAPHAPHQVQPPPPPPRPACRTRGGGVEGLGPNLKIW